MAKQSALHGCWLLTASKRLFAVTFAGLLLTGTAHAHGGGLDAAGCHRNRQTGEYHCHRGGSRTSTATASSLSAAGARSANSFVPTRGAPAGQTCYTGPRGGTYTITASGRKNYGGC